MTAKTKSIAIIIGTLLVGMIIGALATGAVFSQRVAELQALRNENGLMLFLERVIEPTDEAQREQIQEVLQETAKRQMEIRRSIALEHREIFEDLRAELGEILTADQKVALREWIEQDRRRRPRLPFSEGMRRPGPPPGLEGAPFDSTSRRGQFKRRRLEENSQVPADSSVEK